MGVAKQGVPGIRFADVLVIEERPPAGQPPRVETFSFKSRDLTLLKAKPLAAQMRRMPRAALNYYGGNVGHSAAFPQAAACRCSGSASSTRAASSSPRSRADMKAAVNEVKEESREWRCWSNEGR